MREAANQRGCVQPLELVELAAVDDARDDFANVVCRAEIGRHHAVQLRRIVARLGRPTHLKVRALLRVQSRDDAAAQRQRVPVVLCVVVHHAGGARVHVGPAQLLGRHHLADRRFHQWRAGEEDRALVPHDDALVRHRRNVGAARRAGTHHHRDLRNALGGHGRLIKKNTAKMLAIRKNLVLLRQEGAAGIDQIDAGQPVHPRDLLRAQMLLHRHREVGAALHRGIVGDDDAFPPRDAPDAGDDAR